LSNAKAGETSIRKWYISYGGRWGQFMRDDT